MNLNENILTILKNFASINPNIVFEKGSSTLSTMAEARNIVATAALSEPLDRTFGIYDLNQFLSSLSLVTNPQLEFHDGYVNILDSSNFSKVKYYFSDPSMLTYPKKSFSLPSEDVEFDLTWDVLSKIRKAASVLSFDNLVIENDGNSLKLTMTDIDNNTSNAFSLTLPGKFSHESNFSLVFNINNLKLIVGDYSVKISKKLISEFVRKDSDVKYFIALETTSQYGE